MRGAPLPPMTAIPARGPVRLGRRVYFWVCADGCWHWCSNTTKRINGYGRINRDGRMQLAHRYLYEHYRGPIPDGLTLDHLCRNRLCVNPHHLEPTTARENALRGVGPTAVNAKMAICRRGHPFNDANTYYTKSGSRQCRPCCRELAACRKPPRPSSCGWCGRPITQARAGRNRKYCCPTHCSNASRKRRQPT